MKFIPVSALGDYLFCPRSAYLALEMRLARDATTERAMELMGSMIRKELSLRQHEILENLSVPSALEEALYFLLDDLLEQIKKGPGELSIYDGAVLEKCASDIRPGLLGELSVMTEKLAYMIDEAGIDGALKRIRPWKTGYFVKSGLLGYSGRVDKVMSGRFYYPVDIKTCRYSGGVWDADRMEICAYSLLLEEDSGSKVPHGLLEYARSQEKIPVLNTAGLRKKTLEAKDEIMGVLEGDIPEVCTHGNGRKCSSCGFFGKCYDI